MSSSGYIATGLAALVNAIQVGAYQILSNASLSQFTSVTATTNSCLLPLNPVYGQVCKIRNDSATFFPLNIFPQVGGTINGLGANVQYILPVGGLVELASIGGIAWLVTSQSNAQLVEPVNVTAIAVTGALTPAQCGIVNVTSAAANIVVTLPALQIGLRYHILIAATAGTNTVTVTSPAANIKSIICGAATLVTNIASTNIIYGTTAVAGDYIDLYCDGTFWHGIACANIAAAITRS